MPQPAGDKNIEIADDWRQALKLNLVVILQQQSQVLPRREGIAGQIEESIKRFIAADVHSVAFERQPEHADDAQYARRRQYPQTYPAANDANKQEDSKRNDDISPGPANDGISQQTKCDGADEEEYPRFIILTQKIDHQHCRNEKVEETL